MYQECVGNSGVQIFAEDGQEMEKSFTKQVLQDNKRNTGGPCTRTQCSVSRGVVTMIS
jgi:hypothetical protein